MTWLAWRQFRAQAVTAVAAVAAFAIVLAITRSHMDSLYAGSGITSCHGGACAGLATHFLVLLTSGGGVPLLPDGTNAYVILYFLSVVVVLIAPAIIGIFWGAPLISRELETGTYRLAWNQSITRTRWLAVKLALTGLAAMAVAEAFSLLQGWWAAPIGKAVGLGGSASIMSEGRFGSFVFPSHGNTPLGYAAFGFALGVTVGLLIRRAIPAMAVTLAIFIAVQFITPLWIRPNLIPPHQTIATTQAAQATIIPNGGKLALTATRVPGQPGAWITSGAAVYPAGQPAAIPAACLQHVVSGSPRLVNCLASHGIRVAVSYQPLNRFWPLQFAETGLFLVLTLALAGLCFYRLDRRLT
jgi:ABC-2 family transporter protein